MKKIIWLTEWYPVDFEPYNGDQIERHAQAASITNYIYVIFIKKDSRLPFGKIKKEERQYNENCKAVIYFYPALKGFGKWADKLMSIYYFFRLHFKAIRQFRKSHGRPDGIQVNIAMRNGIIALWFKFFHKLRYVVLERWTIYQRESKPYWKDKNFLFQFFAKKIFKNAAAVMTVSAYLGENVCRETGVKKYYAIPNVIDSSVFYYKSVERKDDTLQFIHISNLAYGKNIPEMLTGFRQFLDAGYKARLIVFSPDNAELKALIEKLGLQSFVVLKLPAQQPELAGAMQASDALILFSRYESFGIVVIEANACGIPVITSNHPAFSETVENNSNGTIAKGMDAASLKNALIEFAASKQQFNHESIAANTKDKYSYQAIGKRFNDVYSEAFNPSAL